MIPVTVPTPAEGARAKRAINGPGAPYRIPVRTRRNSGRVVEESALIFAACPMAAYALLPQAITAANDALYRHFGPKVGALIVAYERTGFAVNAREGNPPCAPTT